MRRTCAIAAAAFLLPVAACGGGTKPTTTFTVTATRGGGADMTAAAHVLSQRMASLGDKSPDVQVNGATITVKAAVKTDRDTITKLIAPGRLEFRQVSGVTTVDACESSAPGTEPATACGAGNARYTLDPVALTNADVSNATSSHGGEQCPDGWCVLLTFSTAGQAKFTALTRQAMSGDQPAQVAILLDGVVLAAPTVQGVITGPALVSQLDQAQAAALVAQVRSGVLPVPLTLTSFTPPG